jgi:hypothetical protein
MLCWPLALLLFDVLNLLYDDKNSKTSGKSEVFPSLQQIDNKNSTTTEHQI